MPTAARLRSVCIIESVVPEVIRTASVLIEFSKAAWAAREDFTKIPGATTGPARCSTDARVIIIIAFPLRQVHVAASMPVATRLCGEQLFLPVIGATTVTFASFWITAS
jgi:hypothetical protein